MSNIFYLQGRPQPIPRFLRVSEHRRLEHLLAAGRLPYERFVFEAGGFKEQFELASALRQAGHELVLDTNIAELSAIGRFKGVAKNAPWAKSESILTESELKRGASDALLGQIARFAIENQFSRVLAPCHYVTGANDTWFEIDLDNCIALRLALDAQGGKGIAIDYLILTSAAVLNDPAQRRAMVARFRSVPADSFWIRASGFGVDATGAALQKYILALQDLHSLNKPIVTDGTGGLVGLAVTSFGAASAISFGVAGKERFDASSWSKPPKATGGGGGYCVLLTGIDRPLKRDEAEAIMLAPGARRLLSCNDQSCCLHGFEDTLRDTKGHFLRQRAKMFDAVSAVPEPMRIEHFLNHDMKHADRMARQVAKLKIPDNSLVKRLVGEATRIDRMRPILEKLQALSSSMTRSVEMKRSSAIGVTKAKYE